MKKYVYKITVNVDRNNRYEEVKETFYSTFEKAINAATALLGNRVVDCASIKRELDVYGPVNIGSVCIDSYRTYYEYLVYSIDKMELL